MDNQACQEFKISGQEFLKSGQLENGISLLLQYSECNPLDFDVHALLGEAYAKLSEHDLALEYYAKAIKNNPTHTSNLLKFSSLYLSGDNYLTVLKLSHEKLMPKRYLEIGVCKGVSFSLVDSDVVAVGIDPEPQLDIASLPNNHQLVSETSDDYFKSGRIKNDFNNQPLDMAFLDGMHLFEYALRDFMNLEKHSHAKSVVFVHDVYPMNAETSTRERNSDFWSGDVWKLVLCLKEYRPDLELEVLPCPPTGLGVITGLDASSNVLADKYDEIIAKYIKLPFDKIHNQKDEKLLLATVDSPWLEK